MGDTVKGFAKVEEDDTSLLVGGMIVVDDRYGGEKLLET